MNVIIDRFEGGYAVVETENGEFVNLPAALVPPGAREGAVLTIAFDADATKRRLEASEALVQELWKD